MVQLMFLLVEMIEISLLRILIIITRLMTLILNSLDTVNLFKYHRIYIIYAQKRNNGVII